MTDKSTLPLVISCVSQRSHERVAAIVQKIPLEHCEVSTLPELYSRTTLGHGVVILDLVFDGQNAIDVVSRLRSSRESFSVILWSNAIDIPTALQAVKVGAADVLRFDCPQIDLLNSILEAVQRSQSNLERVNGERHLRTALGQMSNRELEVLHALLRGASTKQIAASLNISPRTVEFAKKRVLDSCQSGSVVELAQRIAVSERLRSAIAFRVGMNGRGDLSFESDSIG